MTQDLLIRQSPARYFAPPYVGPSGWVGIYLDNMPDWEAVAERLRDARDLAATPARRRSAPHSTAPRPSGRPRSAPPRKAPRR